MEQSTISEELMVIANSLDKTALFDEWLNSRVDSPKKLSLPTEMVVRFLIPFVIDKILQVWDTKGVDFIASMASQIGHRDSTFVAKAFSRWMIRLLGRDVEDWASGTADRTALRGIKHTIVDDAIEGAKRQIRFVLPEKLETFALKVMVPGLDRTKLKSTSSRDTYDLAKRAGRSLKEFLDEAYRGEVKPPTKDTVEKEMDREMRRHTTTPGGSDFKEPMDIDEIIRDIEKDLE